VTNEFFQEQREQSQIKARIVSKYFTSWASVILGAQKQYPHIPQKMGYVDLFAGPGRYDDQSKSTPILVLETILANPDFTERIITLFNDKDGANVESLKNAINQINGITRLKHHPLFFNLEIGDEIVKELSQAKMIPTFFFVDPWGYKGLSLKLVSSIIKDWGCDCVLFFNYNRINMGVTNDAIKSHMISLFGDEQLGALRKECDNKSVEERETIVLQAMCDALKDGGSRFVLPFRFTNDAGTRTSHHLIFLSKNFRGYEIMKEIMHKESSEKIAGVASFGYNPQDIKYKQGSLLDLLASPIAALQDMVVKEYKGRTIDFVRLYEEHSVDKPYVRKNYKEAMIALLIGGKINAVNGKTGKPPRKGTFYDDMRITFSEGL
jgi:three-Cys-motif partner protein